MEFTGIIMAIALVMIVIYYLVNTIPPAGSSKDAQVIAIFEDAGCITCHQKNSNTPFYADIPLIGQIIKNDRANGYRKFNIGESLDQIKKEEAVNEVILAKIEMATIIHDVMPPAGYYLIHWGASVTPAKQTILREWIKKHREKFYPNTLATDSLKNEPVRPLPSSLTVNKRKAALGKELFYDKRLSADNTVSCASCHNPDKGGANNKQYAEGADKRLGNVNTPTVYNAYFNIAQAWDGHSANIKELVREHIITSVIMGNDSFADVIERLQKDEGLKKRFDHLYEDGMTGDAITDAIAEFEKTLLTPDCSFDKYLKGDNYAINKKEIFGYELFKSNKCATCHAGIIFGGQSFELMGIYNDYFGDRGWEITAEDLGRFNYTAEEYDRYRFKVPGLRNVALTKPYFHDGSRQTLSDAIAAMGTYQTNRTISDEEINAIAAFLETLTGE
jgi:cytochrome c peroxidase